VSGRLSVVTGGSHGIGRAVAIQLTQRGDRVVACGTDRAALESLAAETRGAAQPLVLDITDRDAVYRELGGLGPLHAVVASAGVCETAGLEQDPDDALWHRVLDVNLNGLYYTLKAAAPQLQSGGRIAIVSSGLGKLGRARYHAYTASKHAALGLMKCLSKELAPRGITVNAVCPGWVDTRMARRDVELSAQADGISADEAFAQAVSGIAIGRFVTPEEVASLISYLTSDAAGAITGEAYNISGGEFFA
jgi:NAD(P)-dependent dehydrogenase (short-subunit alcohol dehydrogenase family)